MTRKIFMLLALVLVLGLSSCTTNNIDNIMKTEDQNKELLVDENSDDSTHSISNFSYLDLYPEFSDILAADYIEFSIVEYLCYEQGQMFSDFYYFEDLISGEVIEVMNAKDEYTFIGGYKYVLALIENEGVDYYSLASFNDNAIYPIVENHVVLPERYNAGREETDNYINNFFEEVGIIYDGTLQQLDNTITNGGVCNNPDITDDYPTLSSLTSSEYGNLFYLELISVEEGMSTSELTFKNLLTNETLILVHINDAYTFEPDSRYILLLTKAPDSELFILTDTDSILRVVNDLVVFPYKYLKDRTNSNDISSVLVELELTQEKSVNR